MEQLQGNALEAFLKNIDPIQNSNLYSQLFALALKALQAIHAKGIWHGDIKPQHIFFSLDRTTAQFVDFGASMLPKRAEEQHAAVAAARQGGRSEADVQRIPSYVTAVEGVFIGTPGYFSEMDCNLPNAQLQDIYALGKSFNDWLIAHFVAAGVDPTIDRVNTIIQQMTVENPANRISLAEALRQLEVY